MAVNNNVILIVGTTADYIDWIRKISPDRCLFLTDASVRRNATEPNPKKREEILCDLNDYRMSGVKLSDYLRRWDLKLDGITCFDCESMELAAVLARQYSLTYPSCESIGFCRDKYVSKTRWKEKGLKCPRIKKICSLLEATDFFMEIKGPMILKPRTGSGSELVFLCKSPAEAKSNYESICRALENQPANRLYRTVCPANELIVAEEFIAGEEYSCDFLIDHKQAHLLRLTKKIPALNRPCGTIHGYLLIDSLPGSLHKDDLLKTLYQSAESLQISYGICMMDFIVKNHDIYLLETAPRPGGDCIPHLLRKVRGWDILEFSLDVARGKYSLPSSEDNNTRPGFMGFRILGKKEGIIKKIETSAAEKDGRILEITLSRRPGHLIKMPPDDYSSWILGHVIARIDPDIGPEEQLREMHEEINIVMDKN
ncbi:MAG: ATP-grasp domain-containing protein [Candidatus Omnitrophota bacterium]